MKNRIKISVDGKSFTLVGEETELHMQAVAAYIHEKIVQIRKNAEAVKMDTSLAYVLTALNVADDYIKEKEKNAELEGRNLGLCARLEELVSQLDEANAKLEGTTAQTQEQIETALDTDEENQPAICLEEEKPEESKQEMLNQSKEVNPQQQLADSRGEQTAKNTSRKAKKGKKRKK
ncbi:MAG: cell division protein ZapA [Anaerotignum sp.]|nr:cell division protein ZapA [Anaerotignum sp.]